jgi:hypothetical protein
MTQEEQAAMFKFETNRIREVSGEIDSTDKLVCFLYELMRDHLPPGKVQQIVFNSIHKETTRYTNGWLALYAKDLAESLTR